MKNASIRAGLLASGQGSSADPAGSFRRNVTEDPGLAASRSPPRRPALRRAGRGTGLTIHLAAQLRSGSRRQDPEPRLDRLD